MPKIVNHDEYREKMLEKSLYLFTRKGYSNINMQQIAAEVGVSKGTLYHYFSSKEEMLVAMITWIGDKNMDEYIRRTSSVESIRDRFDLMVDFRKEKSELYENIMLLAIDVYRNVDIKRLKELYSFFAERYTDGMSDRLNISKQFAFSIFIYFIGLSFHSLVVDETKEYNKHIDFLYTILRSLIVDVPDDMGKAAQKFKEIIHHVLMNKCTSPRTTSIKKNKKNKTTKAITKRR